MRGLFCAKRCYTGSAEFLWKLCVKKHNMFFLQARAKHSELSYYLSYGSRITSFKRALRNSQVWKKSRKFCGSTILIHIAASGVNTQIIIANCTRQLTKKGLINGILHYIFAFWLKKVKPLLNDKYVLKRNSS